MNLISELIRKYYVNNMAGLFLMKVAHESAKTVMNFHFNNLITLITVCLSSMLLLLGLERQIVGVIAIMLMVLFFVFFGPKHREILDAIKGKEVESLGHLRTSLYLFTILSHLFVIILICVIGYFSFKII